LCCLADFEYGVKETECCHVTVCLNLKLAHRFLSCICDGVSTISVWCLCRRCSVSHWCTRTFMCCYCLINITNQEEMVIVEMVTPWSSVPEECNCCLAIQEVPCILWNPRFIKTHQQGKLCTLLMCTNETGGVLIWLLCSKDPAASAYPEPYKSNPHPKSFFKTYCNIFYPSKARSPEWLSILPNLYDFLCWQELWVVMPFIIKLSPCCYLLS
jgi:hypothetical protein